MKGLGLSYTINNPSAPKADGVSHVYVSVTLYQTGAHNVKEMQPFSVVRKRWAMRNTKGLGLEQNVTLKPSLALSLTLYLITIKMKITAA